MPVMMKEAMLYEKQPATRVRCNLCAHHCVISDGKYGVCGVRENRQGTLFTHVYGEVIANHVDPIEKKPLYHFLPGSRSYSIATVGCNFKCSFCQNWKISQASKKGAFTEAGYELKPEEVVREAKKHRCKSISYTYTEPTIFFEYAYDTAKIAKKEGLGNNFVTNGFMSPEALSTIQPYLDACNVDLKFFTEEKYRTVCGGALGPVLASIALMRKLGIWVEVTTLIVPGLNDSEDQLRAIAQFISGVGREIPWHVSRFHPDYQMTAAQPTPAGTLRRAYDIGKRAGLKYVYLGNVLEGLDTFCYNCGKIVVERGYFTVEKMSISGGQCPHCGVSIDGVWE